MDRRAYLTAILTEPGDITLYRNNAFFKQGLDTYIEMIPIFVDGLKKHARVENNKMKNMEKALREMPTSLSYSDSGGWRWMDDR